MKTERWILANAAAMPAAVLIAAFVPGASFVLPLAGLVSLGILMAASSRLSAADAVSALRALGGAGAFGMALSGRYGGYVYIALLMAAELTDFFDGRIARARGSSDIGGNLDMDTDAFFIMLLSFSAFRFGGFGAWVLVPGLLRYLFVFVFEVIRPVPVESKALSLFMKSACVAAVISLVVANAAFLPETLRLIGALAGTAVLAVSFSWETADYAARRPS